MGRWKRGREVGRNNMRRASQLLSRVSIAPSASRSYAASAETTAAAKKRFSPHEAFPPRDATPFENTWGFDLTPKTKAIPIIDSLTGWISIPVIAVAGAVGLSYVTGYSKKWHEKDDKTNSYLNANKEGGKHH
eukprot:TRINITY_DN78075_c0_g2_i1.p3 TRINITY_DN78075_c0_g2~~TRINITY_DN78075_c0_g2_i1.p3  ORF type:complete len:133 (+),score=15.62 TRINITY_DN78075_c0_g2_i1:367-765(+)